MPVELIWLAGVVAVGAAIVGSALYSEASEQYRRRLAKSQASYKPRLTR